MMAAIIQHLVTGSYPLEWPGHWIGGSWRKGGKSKEEKISYNPSRGSPLMMFSSAREMMTQAVEEGQHCFQNIQELPLEYRRQLLQSFAKACREHKTILAHALQVEAGKPAWEAYGEGEAACQYLDWMAAHGHEALGQLLAPAALGPHMTHSQLSLQAVGVTVAYLPFSSPLTSFAVYFASALLAGCPLVLVSSSQAALSALLLTSIAEKLQIPRGLFNTVFGGFSEFKYALSDKRVKAAIYTGSKEHCDGLRKDYQGFRNRQLILQSGGKNAALVHSSAHMETAIRAIVYGAFRSAGQLCSSTSRAFVYRSQLAEFRERMFEAINRMAIGPTDDLRDGPTGGPWMGPLYSCKSIEKYLRFQTMAYREASESLQGRELELSKQGGYFVSPGLHFMRKFDSTSAYQSNILFSPDLAVYSYDHLHDAIQALNTTDSYYSLAFFGDESIIRDRRHLLQVPNLQVNAPTTELTATLPLAGRSDSSHHLFQGPGLALYLTLPQALRHDPNDWETISSWPWWKT